MKKVFGAMTLAAILGASGCAYTVVNTPSWSMYRISLMWKTDGEITIATNGTVSAKGSSSDDGENIKAAVGAAVEAAVKTVK